MTPEEVNAIYTGNIAGGSNARRQRSCAEKCALPECAPCASVLELVERVGSCQQILEK